MIIRTAAEIAWTHKYGFTAIMGTASTNLASAMSWLSDNIIGMTSAATLILTVVMIFSYIFDTLRKNRSHRAEMRRQELEIEKLKRELDSSHNKLD